MRRRLKSLATAVALVLSMSAAGLLAGSGTAAAAEPIVIGSCAASVEGSPGQPVSLAPAAVLGVVTDAVRAVPVLGPPLAGAANQAFAALPPIPIGALPTGKGYITGGTIANAVTAELKKIPLLGPVLAAVVKTVQGVLSLGCGVTVNGVNAVSAPVQDGADAVADTSEQVTAKVIESIPGLPGAPGGGGGGGTNNPGTNDPGNPGTNDPGTGGGMPAPNQPPLGGLSGVGLDLYQPGLSNFGRWPMADYSNIPFARAGLWAPSPGVRYGGGVPGYSPEFGIVGDTPPDDGVSVAGRAEAIDPPAGQRVELPVLLAVLALSCVMAALVRTWVLRRAPRPAL
ncbi:hypothetical protein [Actinophytocola glycyrrhizae]|uniref:Uncharacterized protein n=1 Tax=Actinophytocola glycyrrhizae TaxID=2044873 RepID=A0ABV9S1W8_9PSEU